METAARLPGETRRSFLKKLGGLLLAGAAAGRLAGASTPLPPVKTATGEAPYAHPVSTDWNELSDPGWSG